MECGRATMRSISKPSVIRSYQRTEHSRRHPSARQPVDPFASQPVGQTPLTERGRCQLASTRAIVITGNKDHWTTESGNASSPRRVSL